MTEKTFSAQEIAVQLSADLGRVVSAEYVLSGAHSIWPNYEGRMRGEKFTAEFKSRFCDYAFDWHQKHSPITFKAFLESHGRAIPKPYAPLVAAKPKAKPESASGITLEQVEAIIAKREGALREEVFKKIASTAPVGFISASVPDTRDNDARIRLIEDSIQVFQRENDISRKRCLARLEELYRIAHPLYAKCHEGQEFEHWLRTSGHIEEFIHELNGLLDAVHDELTPKGRPGELAL